MSTVKRGSRTERIERAARQPNGEARVARLPDEEARTAIRSERQRNLLVIAGAGTGKTTSIIDRVVSFLAPEAEGEEPVPIERLAIITFTRRAAGELRFRVRERLLDELARMDRREGRRAELLRQAIPALDAAAIGTIHGFADRLLKLRPVEASLSPAYTLAEDNVDLISEAFRRLRRAAETGQLGEELLGGGGPDLPSGSKRRRRPIGGGRQPSPALIDEAAETLRAATRGGLQMERRETIWGPLPSLEDIVSRMIDSRDVELAPPPLPDPGLDAMRSAWRELERRASRFQVRGRGPRHVLAQIHALRRLEGVEDASEAFAILNDALGGRELYKGRDFPGPDDLPWWIYKALRGERRVGDLGRLGDELRGPYRWLATRIVRLVPVVAAMYERVKEEHEVVDYLDLLVKLRDLLRDDREARRFYQEQYAHIFVDEFQDTDPLQCEVLFYLCEDGVRAREWSDVHLRPGRLTLVGDPKQSIYRFRRADVVTYASAARMLEAQGARVLLLSTNFRSQPELVRYYNLRLEELLGRRPGGDRRRSRKTETAVSAAATRSTEAIDPDTGQAFYEPLAASPAIPAAERPLHLLPYSGPDGAALTVDGGGREIEAELIARYLTWLLASRTPVRDPVTGEARPVRAGDIAVLTPVTTSLHLLLSELDRLGIEHSIRGGTLFLSQPLVRRYLLALRALADRDDGVAEAALLGPPFFALDELDLAMERFAGRVELHAIPPEELAERRARVEEARAVVRELRAARHRRNPGATARDLIERTGLGRAALVGPNGRQALTALYEVSFEFERRALAAGLDFDAATAVPRSWAAAPVFLDLAEPLGEDAVRVMTIYQAKGLEFPVVVIWDGFQRIGDRVTMPWFVGRDGRSWALSLRPVSVEEPPDSGLVDREKVIAKHERARLYYVAATRARDLLALPVPETKGKSPYATAVMAAVGGEGEELVRRFDPFTPGVVPEWAVGNGGTHAPEVVADRKLDRRLDQARARFVSALDKSARPVAVPRAITEVAAERARVVRTGGDEKRAGETDAGDEWRAAKAERSRFGRSFGIAVHRALELLIGGASGTPAEAAAVAVAATGLDLPASARAELAALEKEVAADVERALGALASAGLTEHPLSTEVDVTAIVDPAELLRGVIDLLVIGPKEVFVIDWKTDAPVAGTLARAYPVYAEQLRLYMEALRSTGLAGSRTLRAGLILTATGELRWLGRAV